MNGPTGVPQTPIEVEGDALRRSLSQYRNLISRYISGDVDGRAFEAAFFKLSSDDPYGRPEPIYNLMDNFFVAVDAYVADPELRTEPEDLDDDQLRAIARQHLADLDQALAQER